VDAKHSKILIRPENGDILLIDSQQHGRAQQRTHFAEYLTSPTTRLGIQVHTTFLVLKTLSKIPFFWIFE